MPAVSARDAGRGRIGCWRRFGVTKGTLVDANERRDRAGCVASATLAMAMQDLEGGAPVLELDVAAETSSGDLVRSFIAHFAAFLILGLASSTRGAADDHALVRSGELATTSSTGFDPDKKPLKTLPGSQSTVFGEVSSSRNSLRLGHAFAQRFGRDTLIEGHVLAAQLDVQRAFDQVGAKMPLRNTSRPISAIADQEIGDGVFVVTFLVRLASLQRLVTEDRECIKEFLLAQTAFVPSYGVPKILFEVRHPSLGGELINSRRNRFRRLCMWANQHRQNQQSADQRPQ